MFALSSAAIATVVEPPVLTRVRAWLAQPDATMLPRDALSASVTFQSNLCSLRGADAYCAAAVRWHADAEELLLPYRSTSVRCAYIAENQVVIRWRA
eukprot:515226-Prymnesium_polylepis.1